MRWIHRARSCSGPNVLIKYLVHNTSPSDFQPAKTTPGFEVANPISQYYTMYLGEACVAEWLTPRTPDLEFQDSSLTRFFCFFRQETLLQFAFYHPGPGCSKLG